MSLWKLGVRFLFRQTWRHPWQTILMIVGITIGVAVAVAIDLANASASRAFDLSTEEVTGRATHQITGGPEGLNESVYVDLKRSGIQVAVAPIITAYVSSPQLGSQPLQLLGVDPFAEFPFRNYLGNHSGIDLPHLTAFLTKPNSVLISPDLALRYGLQSCGQEAINKRANCEIRLDLPGKQQSVSVIGLIGTKGNDQSSQLNQRALQGLLLTDISTAQELTGKLGFLDRIDLILPSDCAEAIDQGVPSPESKCPEVDQIKALISPVAVLSPIETRTETIKQMTAAFRLNLTALSLLALVVGMFLIYNTMTFSVVQRRPVFGILRCLGVTRQEIFILVMAEASLVGTLGAALGLILGVLMGQGAVQMVTRTINDLYFVVTVQGVQVPITSLIKGFTVGVLTTLLTAGPPAWEAASVPPREALSRAGLESKAGRAVRLAAGAGLVLIMIGGVLLLSPIKNLVASFLGTFAVIVGLAMLTPIATKLIMHNFTKILGRFWGTLGRMAPRNVVNSQSRTSVAIAALTIAISVTIGVSVMVNSFRYTVIEWLEQTLQGDIYISPPSITATQSSATLNPSVIELLKDWPGVERIDVLRSIYIDSPYGPLHIAATDNPNLGNERHFLNPKIDPDMVMKELQEGSVFISEPLANRLDLPRQGAVISLLTQTGMRDFPVVGVYYDYASSEGTILMTLSTYQEWWRDDQLSAIALRLLPGVDADQTTNELKERLAPIQQLLVRPNQALRQDVLKVFDQTFAITGALQLLALIVAFIGILSSLLSLELDKQRELGILRAVGVTTRQLWGLIMVETGLMGSVAGFLAMPTGLTLALILIYIINRRSFGWTMQMQVTPEPFIQALGVAMGAALLAAIYPAVKMSRIWAADALRAE